MTDITHRIEGFEKVKKKLLRDIPRRVIRLPLTRALRKAARPMVLSAREKARRGKSDSLAISMSSWAENPRKLRGGVTAARLHVGPRRSNRRAIIAYFQFYRGGQATPKEFVAGIRHGHLVEFGTSRTSARPFLRPALDATGQLAINTFGSTIGNEVEKEAAKR